jgi:hypothetical protein
MRSCALKQIALAPSGDMLRYLFSNQPAPSKNCTLLVNKLARLTQVLSDGVAFNIRQRVMDKVQFHVGTICLQGEH